MAGKKKFDGLKKPAKKVAGAGKTPVSAAQIAANTGLTNMVVQPPKQTTTNKTPSKPASAEQIAAGTGLTPDMVTGLDKATSRTQAAKTPAVNSPAPGRTAAGQTGGQAGSVAQGAISGAATGGAATVTTTQPDPAGNSYSLEEFLRQQYAAQTEAALAELKSAYESSLAGYRNQAAQLPQLYDQARNRTAAQSAQAQRSFQEQANAAGLNSGASGQAALARSSVLQGNLAGIDREQSAAQAALDLEIAQLTSEYQSAIAQARASGEAGLANALYQEMIRMQELEYQMERDKEADRQWQLAFDASRASRAASGGNQTSERTQQQTQQGSSLDGRLDALRTSSMPEGTAAAGLGWKAGLGIGSTPIQAGVPLNMLADRAGMADYIENELNRGTMSEKTADALLRMYGE